MQAKPKTMGVIGEGISHSLSPKIHTLAISKLGIDATYQCFDVKKEELSTLLSAMWQQGAIGFNVTMPHKNTIAQMYAGGALSSVNTLYRGESGWLATSTDAPGLDRALNRMGYRLSGFKKIVFIGNGGVTLAIAEHLARQFRQHPELVVLRRSARRDALILHAVSQDSNQPRFEPLSKEFLAQEVSDLDGASLLIQATSAPLRGDDLSYLTPALKRFRGVFVDLVYGQPSALLGEARSLGLEAMDGLPMLIEQARLSQQYWWQTSLDYESIYQSLVP